MFILTWDDIWKIIIGSLASVGGIGGIIFFIIKFSADNIAQRLQKRYSLELNKDIEKFKSNLDNKIYISKTKFDTEFSIYRELSKTFFEAVKAVSIMIPTGLAFVPADENDRKEYEQKCYLDASKAVVNAQDALNSNAPFIQTELFDKYQEILRLCMIQLDVFQTRWNLSFIGSQHEKELISREDYQRTKEINDKFNSLNINIREYLSKLDVLE